jgi:hypothetical protein
MKSSLSNGKYVKAIIRVIFEEVSSVIMAKS